MNNLPILMTEESWLNSQLSVVRHTGMITVNGIEYIVAGTDLVQRKWMPIIATLGRERTIGLIKNGTTLDVAKQMCEQLKEMRKQQQLKLF